MTYDLISEEREKFTPKEGFNLVGIDPHGKPGDSLYLIGHFDTKDEAELEQKNHSSNTVIYPN